MKKINKIKRELFEPKEGHFDIRINGVEMHFDIDFFDGFSKNDKESASICFWVKSKKSWSMTTGPSI